ncbi:MAG: TolC family protein [Candidatus Obscuribacterales bacterium]|nr:TolC family protein [Cyanobacteria bacterium HKST-UBA01]MCB9472170.1 TolC family protein [Candidatus Obscuribacterales bacterium]
MAASAHLAIRLRSKISKSIQSARKRSNSFELISYYSLARLAMMLYLSLALQAPAMAADGSVPLRGLPSKSIPDPGAPTKTTPLHLQAKQVQTKKMTLKAAVDMAVYNFPKMKQMQAQVDAAKKTVSLQKIKEYMPDSLASYQTVMSTHNKLTQVLIPDPTLPPNPGPGTNAIVMSPVFSSGTGFILDWDPIDFGLHKARIDLRKQQLKQARANLGITELDVATSAAQAFLELIVAKEQVKAAAFNVHNFEVFEKTVSSMVAAELRPGADASLAQAQIAKAKNLLIEAKKMERVAMANLAESLGIAGTIVAIDPFPILDIEDPPNVRFGKFIVDDHPVAVAGKQAVDVVEGRLNVLDKTYYPKLHFWGGCNLRGAGLSVEKGNQRQSRDVHGLFPLVPNYHIGMMVQIPFLDYWQIKAEKNVERCNLSAEKSAYDVIAQQLTAQDERAKALLEAAVGLVQNVPAEVEAAEEAKTLAVTRYQVGLGTVADVAQAEQILAQAKFRLASARIGVWKAMLAIGVAHGDLKPLLSAIEKGKQ